MQRVDRIDCSCTEMSQFHNEMRVQDREHAMLQNEITNRHFQMRLLHETFILTTCRLYLLRTTSIVEIHKGEKETFVTTSEEEMSRFTVKVLRNNQIRYSVISPASF